jgi:hypothetical protein
MRALYLVIMMTLTGCGDKKSANKGSQKWEPQGFFDASEVLTTNNFLLFSTGRVTRFFSDRHPEWLGWYESTNGVWVWHLYANQWELRPDGESLFVSELGNPSLPWLGQPTNKFHLKRTASLPEHYRRE